MAYPSERSFLKNVSVPRYVSNAPFHESPMNGTGFSHANIAFLDHNHATSNYQPMDAVRLQDQQWPWLSAPSNSSMSNTIPFPQKRTASKNGVAVPIAMTPPIDYTLLLLSLAEDYFAAAYGEGSLTAVVGGEGEMQPYYGLIATGLGCLEAVLKVKLPAMRHSNGVDLKTCSISDCSPGWRRWYAYDMLLFYMRKRKMRWRPKKH